MKFSLVIPCYNEAENLPLLLERCRQVGAHEGVEVILVDNGSTDRSAEILNGLLDQYPGCRMVQVEKNQGYGHGILSGLAAAEGRILGWTHADMQTDPMDALNGLELFGDGDEGVFVKGRRYGRPLGDVFFTAGMSLFDTLLLRRPMWDINAQPTMFSRAFYETWQQPPQDFSLDLYAYYLAVRGKLTVRRFPVHFGDRAHGTSHWNINLAGKIKFIRRTVEFSLQLRKSLLP
jgi:glycosyltransferase involved in cell wall biosynthesis